MDVEGLAEIGLAHRRAFDVPARPAAPPGTVPARQLRRRRLPQHEIGGIALVGRDLDAGAGDHLVARAAARACRNRGMRRHREQHVMFGDIGVAARRSAARSWRSSGRYARWRAARHRAAAQPSAAASSWKMPRPSRSVSARMVLAVGLGRGVDLVVDVGDVADIAHVVRAIELAQQPVEHVEDDHRPRIADMGEVVDRRAADIHAHELRDRAARRLPCGASACCEGRAARSWIGW